VLSTVFANGPDSFEVIDFMPRYKRGDRDYHCPPDIIRYIRPLSGAPQVRIRYAPRPFFGQYPVKTELLAEFIKTLPIGGPYETVYLYSNIDLVTLIEERPLTIDRA
jgi:hypothetical protein